MANTPVNDEQDNLSDMLVQRLDALESRNVFQDDVIEQLSEELAIHQEKIAELKGQLRLMATRLKEANSAAPEAGQEIEPPPPHF
ncbi:MAG: SlyX family protein [Colwellia sp.]|nr:SlyX family protein [Colwellia sp.]